MLVWGDNAIGHYLGLGKEIESPTQVLESLPVCRDVKSLATSNHQCCILTNEGVVHAIGKKDNDSHGKGISSSRIAALETMNVSDVFAGGEHMFAVTDDGHAYGWGMNDCGQLGLRNSDSEAVKVPKKILLPHSGKLPAARMSRRIVQISCGQKHTLMLLNDGTVYGMGDNSYGQLGTGNRETTASPIELSVLQGLPIAQVVAGGWHSFCVTVSGRVFCWGRNNFGQLGLGDTEDRDKPCFLKMLDSQVVRFVAAGDHHTAALTEDGGVFTFGSSDKGQLGHDTISEYEVNPKKVFELMGSVVTQVACGKQHTIAYVPGCRQIFAFGSGVLGQLGQGCRIDSLRFPTIVDGPWQIKSGSSLCEIKQLAASGNQSFVVLASCSGETALDFRHIPTHRKIWSISPALCETISLIGLDDQVSPDVLSHLECVMSSQSCINASFLDADCKACTKDSGLNIVEVRDLFSKIMQCKNAVLLQKIVSYLRYNVLPSLTNVVLGTEALRLYLALPEFKLFHNPDYYESLVYPFVEKLLSLSKHHMETLESWYGSLVPDFFLTPIKMCQNYIVFIIKLSNIQPIDRLKKSFLMLELLKKLNRVNDSCGTAIVDFRKFYIPELNDLILLHVDYQCWVTRPGEKLKFCSCPFVLDSKAKATLLKTDVDLQKISASEQAMFQNMLTIFRNPGGLEANHTRLKACKLEIEIERDHLVNDAIQKLGKIDNLKLPLTVTFAGEKGEDYGAVRKEFFMLALSELLDPKYGMFCFNEYSHLLWFPEGDSSSHEMYHFIGTLCGLAVYNSEIIDVNFPLALYKKLLGQQPTLSDLKEFDPLLGSSLQQLLEYVEEDGDTVEEIFGLTFIISIKRFGDVIDVELIENGANTPVTCDNRNEYVLEYVDYVFNRSVENRFNSFSRGFMKVCDCAALKLFRPEELMDMFVGHQTYDWDELERSTCYKEEFHRDHPVISWFWEVSHSMNMNEKKEFIRFLTGSSKIPIDGLTFVIRPLRKLDPQPSVPDSQLLISAESVDDYLPVARACFNYLDLPLYSNKEALEIKLKFAIKTQGFHLL